MLTKVESFSGKKFILNVFNCEIEETSLIYDNVFLDAIITNTKTTEIPVSMSIQEFYMRLSDCDNSHVVFDFTKELTDDES